jgi:hypothetical protein
LFERLDRAALVVWAADRLSGPAAGGEHLAAARRALAQTEDFLAERADLFLCLAGDVAAVLSNVRAGLEDDEPELWETLLKHRRIEEARDEIERSPDRYRLFSALPRPAPTAAPAGAHDWSWLPEPQYQMAADAPRAAGVAHRHWREPGGTRDATLVADLADWKTPLRINFRRGDEAAEDMAGQPVWLAGCPNVIDAAGNADFKQDDLIRAKEEGRPVTLLVGESRTAWEPVEHPAV